MVEPRPAGFWIRVVAALIDMVLFAFVQFSLDVVATLAWPRSVDDSAFFELAMSLFTAFFALLYSTVLLALCGQTIGKLVVGVRVVTLDGATPTFGVALLRYFAYYVSALPFGLGFVVAGLRHDKRAIHDLIAGTRVERVPPASPPVESEELRTPEGATPSLVE